ncbi:MAG: sulfite exporter TauE/SafE family protein [Peptococcaceae bacterium]|nr:sulfite exporter TauE/SafE family protein [Peptococcaceae bacterium]
MFSDIELNIIAVSAFAAVLAGFVQRVSGFAFGIVFLSILPYILPYGEAVVISKMLLLIVSVSTAFIYRKDVNWSMAKIIILSLCVFDFIGIFVLTQIDLSNFKCYLGLFLALLGCYALFFKKNFSFQPSHKLSVAFGSITGFCSGLFGVGGPFLAMYLSNSNLGKNVYYATMQCSVFVVMFFDVVMRISHGFATEQALKITVLALPCAFIGTMLGTVLFRRLDSVFIGRLVNVIMIINGLNMFFKT